MANECIRECISPREFGVLNLLFELLGQSYCYWAVTVRRPGAHAGGEPVGHTGHASPVRSVESIDGRGSSARGTRPTVPALAAGVREGGRPGQRGRRLYRHTARRGRGTTSTTYRASLPAPRAGASRLRVPSASDAVGRSVLRRRPGLARGTAAARSSRSPRGRDPRRATRRGG